MPDFQKRHYEAIATAIRETTQPHPTDDGEAVCLKCLVYQLTRLFEADNPHFDVGRFEKAVGLKR